MVRLVAFEGQFSRNRLSALPLSFLYLSSSPAFFLLYFPTRQSTASFSILSNNQLSGTLPSGFLSPGLIYGQFSIGQNYFTGDASVVAAGQVFCPSGQLVQPPTDTNDSMNPDGGSGRDDRISAGNVDDRAANGRGNGRGYGNAAGAGAGVGSSELEYSSASSSSVVNPAPGVVAFTNPALLLNCLSYGATSACGGPLQETQRTAAACMAFCGASLADGPCGGNGECFLQASRSYRPVCRCFGDYLPDIAVAEAGGTSVTYPTCSINSTCELSDDPWQSISPSLAKAFSTVVIDARVICALTSHSTSMSKWCAISVSRLVPFQALRNLLNQIGSIPSLCSTHPLPFRSLSYPYLPYVLTFSPSHPAIADRPPPQDSVSGRRRQPLCT